jgi:hypothetical protein
VTSTRDFSGWRVAVAALAIASGGVSRAQLQADPAAVNLGRHPQDVIVSAMVKLTNAGSGRLVILGTQADCSCTVATPEQTVLEPGGGTTLEVKVETRSYEGVIQRRVSVQTSAGTLVIPVEIAVGGYANWTTSPRFVVFPPSPRGREATAHVTLAYNGSERMNLGSIVATPAYIDADVTSSSDGNSFTLALRKRPEVPAGSHTVKLAVDTTDPVDPRLTVKVFLQVSSALRVTPNPIVLPTVKAGQAATREISLRGWAEGIVPRLELSHGHARIRELSGDHIQIEVTVVPQQPGPSTQLLRIHAGETLEAEVPVIVRAEPADVAK